MCRILKRNKKRKERKGQPQKATRGPSRFCTKRKKKTQWGGLGETKQKEIRYETNKEKKRAKKKEEEEHSSFLCKIL